MEDARLLNVEPELIADSESGFGASEQSVCQASSATDIGNIMHLASDNHRLSYTARTVARVRWLGPERGASRRA